MIAVCMPPYILKSIPDNFFKGLMKQRIETCDGMTYYRLCMMFFVPDRLRTQEMCNKPVCMDPYSLEFGTDCFKTDEMCNKAVRREIYTLSMFLIILRHKTCSTKHCVLFSLMKKAYAMRE